MKIFLFSLLTVAFSFTAFAQRTIKLEVTLTSPATGATITAGAAFDEKFVIKNLGPGAIKPADTIGYVDPSIPSGSYLFRVGYTKAVGDTIQINKTGFSFPDTTSSRAYNWCVYAFAQNRTDRIIFDTTGTTYGDCNMITIKAKPSAGLAETLKETTTNELLSISPNPANAVIAFDFISKGNPEIVAQVYDIAGRVVLTNNYGKSFTGQQGFTLNISELNSGMYFVEFRQDGYKAVGKLSKQ